LVLSRIELLRRRWRRRELWRRRLLGRRHRWTRRRVPSPDKNMKEAKGLEAAGGGNSAAGLRALGRKNPGHPTFHTPYYGLFRWPLFGHFGAEIPTSVLLELVPVGA
jgi:hypothetical protein